MQCMTYLSIFSFFRCTLSVMDFSLLTLKCLIIEIKNPLQISINALDTLLTAEVRWEICNFS